MRRLLTCLVLVAACILPGCQKSTDSQSSVSISQASPSPEPTETPEPTPTPEVTPTPRPTPLRTARVLSLFDLSDGTSSLTPWIIFATGVQSFTSGNMAIQRRASDGTGSAEFGLVFGSDVERQYLDLLSTTPLTDITNLPTAGWIPVRDFNAIQPNRYYGLKLSTGNVQFAINPLSSRELTLDYTFQPL